MNIRYMNKKIKVHLLVNEVAGNGNAVAADYSSQKVLKNLNRKLQ